MPLSRVRCCYHCNLYRYAPCSSGCRVEPENNPQSWIPTEEGPVDDAGFNRQAS